jgi:UDP-N-acetylglucosamine--N-acetylmuramyl-(pentapeptide) pyrophosphoryl-undecaprenol N-acetylglucosamine transferase
MEVSRGDQVQNARYFQKQGISVVVNETELSPETLLAAIDEVSVHRDDIIKKIKALGIESASAKIISIIKEQVRVQLVKTV